MILRVVCIFRISYMNIFQILNSKVFELTVKSVVFNVIYTISLWLLSLNWEFWYRTPSIEGSKNTESESMSEITIVEFVNLETPLTIWNKENSNEPHMISWFNEDDLSNDIIDGK